MESDLTNFGTEETLRFSVESLNALVQSQSQCNTALAPSINQHKITEKNEQVLTNAQFQKEEDKRIQNKIRQAQLKQLRHLIWAQRQEKPQKQVKNQSPQLTGWLYKYCKGNLFQKWQMRYFQLKDCTLAYYHDPDKQPKVTVNFDQTMVEISTQSLDIHVRIVASHYVLKFRAKNREELERWIKALNLSISTSSGCLRDQSLRSVTSQFWKYNRTSQSEFINSVKTGDLLLFRGHSVGSFLTRTFSAGEYDHVAILIKFSSGNVALFEAVSETGVKLLFWDDFVARGYAKQYDRLVHRQLNTSQRSEKVDRFNKFVTIVEGKKYRINPMKILGRKKHGRKSLKDQGGFFCSELVAAAYIYMQLLPVKKAANAYWPKHFAESCSLPLINASLGPEKLIDFGIID